MSCPVVVTKEVGAAELVRDHEAGIVVSGEPALLAAALNSLQANPVLKARMGHNGRQAVAERLTWNAVAKQMEAVYGHLCSTRVS